MQPKPIAAQEEKTRSAFSSIFAWFKGPEKVEAAVVPIVQPAQPDKIGAALTGKFDRKALLRIEATAMGYSKLGSEKNQVFRELLEYELAKEGIAFDEFIKDPKVAEFPELKPLLSSNTTPLSESRRAVFSIMDKLKEARRTGKAKKSDFEPLLEKLTDLNDPLVRFAIKNCVPLFSRELKPIAKSPILNEFNLRAIQPNDLKKGLRAEYMRLRAVYTRQDQRQTDEEKAKAQGLSAIGDFTNTPAQCLMVFIVMRAVQSKGGTGAAPTATSAAAESPHESEPLPDVDLGFADVD